MSRPMAWAIVCGGCWGFAAANAACSVWMFTTIGGPRYPLLGVMNGLIALFCARAARDAHTEWMEARLDAR